MKKLIVTCTAVAFATAFIGCEGAVTEETEPQTPGEELGTDIEEEGGLISEGDDVKAKE